MPNFDLNELEHLAPLVYGTLMAVSTHNQKKLLTTALIPCAEQWKDAQVAYTLVRQIGEHIRKDREKYLTEQRVSSWVFALHRVIAKHAYDDFVGPGPGEYTNQEANLNRHSEELTRALLQDAVNDNSPSFQHMKLMEQDGVAIEDYVSARLVLKRINYTYSGDNILFKVQSAYHSNELSDSDREKIEKFIKICPAKKTVPDLMQRFIRRLVAEWRQCSPTNIEAIVDLVFLAYQQITYIHPFANGNGRLATVFVALITESFGQPAILIKTGMEGYEKNSPARKAIRCMDRDPEPLKAIIRARMQKPYEDNVYRRQIEAQVKLADLAVQIQQTAPSVDVDALFNNIAQSEHGFTSTEELYQCLLATFQKKLASLTGTSTSALTTSIFNTAYSPEGKKIAVDLLQQYTGLAKWTAYNKNGAGFVVYDGGLTYSETEQQGLVDKLNASKHVLATKVSIANDPNHRGVKVIILDECAFEAYVKLGLEAQNLDEALSKLELKIN